MVTEEMDMAVWSQQVQKQALAMDDERGEVRKKAMTQMLELIFPKGAQVRMDVIYFYQCL